MTDSLLIQGAQSHLVAGTNDMDQSSKAPVLGLALAVTRIDLQHNNSILKQAIYVVEQKT